MGQQQASSIDRTFDDIDLTDGRPAEFMGFPLAGATFPDWPEQQMLEVIQNDLIERDPLRLELGQRGHGECQDEHDRRQAQERSIHVYALPAKKPTVPGEVAVYLGEETGTVLIQGVKNCSKKHQTGK